MNHFIYSEVRHRHLGAEIEHFKNLVCMCVFYFQNPKTQRKQHHLQAHIYIISYVADHVI